MSDKKVIGNIGQKYENRKTGETGILIRKDEKYKTVMLENSEGKSFSVSSSSFRSNWRKAISEEPEVETKEEKKEEEKTEEPSVNLHLNNDEIPENIDNDINLKKAKKAIKRIFTEENFNEFIQEVTLCTDGVQLDLSMTHNTTNGRISIKNVGKCLFELWFHFNDEYFNIHMKPYVYENIKWSEGNDNMNVIVRDGWVNNHVLIFERSKLASVLNDVLNGCVEYLKTTNTNEESEEN